MNQFLPGRVRLLVVCVCSLFVMLLFAACGTVAGTGGPGSPTGNFSSGILTGKVVSASGSSVVVDVNGTQYTINGLTAQEVSQLQAAVGKTWTFQVTGNNGTITIVSGTAPQENDNATPVANVTPESNQPQGTGVNEPGSISFIGQVTSVNASSISVNMPNGQTLAMSITAQTELKNGLPGVNQTIKVDAQANTADGSFLATKLESTDSGDLQDQNKLHTVDFQGVTTSAVGSNGVINFSVGNKGYSFTISPTTQVKDFASAQAIPSGQSVKVTVLFNGSNGTVLEVKNGND